MSEIKRLDLLAWNQEDGRGRPKADERALDLAFAQRIDALPKDERERMKAASQSAWDRVMAKHNIRRESE